MDGLFFIVNFKNISIINYPFVLELVLFEVNYVTRQFY